jgi:hypothetical protein
LAEIAVSKKTDYRLDWQARGGLAGNGLQIVLPWPLPIYRHYSQGGLV